MPLVRRQEGVEELQLEMWPSALTYGPPSCSLVEVVPTVVLVMEARALVLSPQRTMQRLKAFVPLVWRQLREFQRKALVEVELSVAQR